MTKQPFIMGVGNVSSSSFRAILEDQSALLKHLRKELKMLRLEIAELRYLLED